MTSRQRRQLFHYGAIIVGLILATAFFFATVLAVMRHLADEPLTSGGSAAYPLIEMTFGLAISAVASTVALLLALRSVQSSDKERSIALLDVYQPEITALVDEVNDLQDRLRDTVAILCDLARSGAHLAQARLFQEYKEANGRIPLPLAKVLDARLEEAKTEYLASKKWAEEPIGWTDDHYPAWVWEKGEADVYFRTLKQQAASILPVSEKATIAEAQCATSLDDFFDVVEAADRYGKDLALAESAFASLCQAYVSPKSGLLHRVLARRFDRLVSGRFAALEDHLADPLGSGPKDWVSGSTLQLRKEGYYALNRLPLLFRKHFPMAFLRSRDISAATLGANRIPAETLQTRIRILHQTPDEDGATRGFPLRGPQTPEELGEWLGRFLPCITHYGAGVLPFSYLAAVREAEDSPMTQEQIDEIVAEMAAREEAQEAAREMTEDEIAALNEKVAMEFAARIAEFPDEHEPPAFEQSEPEPRKCAPFDDAFFRMIDHYPEPACAPAFSPVFVWAIPLLVRMISPVGVMLEVTESISELELDNDLLRRHLKLQLLRLYSYEVFGDSSRPAAFVPDRDAVWAMECLADSERRAVLPGIGLSSVT